MTTAQAATQLLWSHAESLVRMIEAEDMLRAISAGEVDAFVISGGRPDRVLALSTADSPYRQFVENMRDGAATLSSTGLILYANRPLADLLACSRETIVGSSLARFVAGNLPTVLDEHIGGRPGTAADTVELDLVDFDGGLVPVLVGFSPLDVDGDRLTCVTFADLSVQKAQEREIEALRARLAATG